MEPKKMVRVALGIATFVCALATVFFYFGLQEEMPAICLKTNHLSETQEVMFSLGEKQGIESFSFPKIESMFFLTMSSPRPQEKTEGGDVWMHMKEGGVQKLTFPCRVDCCLDEQGFLRFSEKKSAFFLNFKEKTDPLEVEICVKLDKGKTLREKIEVPLQYTPLSPPEDFENSSPFLLFSKAKYWGSNLLKERYLRSEGFYLLEWAGFEHLDEVTPLDWLGWEKEKWVKTQTPSTFETIARIEKETPQGLLIEGWKGEEHIRTLIPKAPLSPFKPPQLELFQSVRIRSEKLVSCKLDKQNLILKAGDWLYKDKTRWRVLRKKQDRDDFLKKEASGELFVLKRIETKHGEKCLIGELYSAAHNQVIPIEVTASNHDRTTKLKPNGRLK